MSRIVAGFLRELPKLWKTSGSESVLMSAKILELERRFEITSLDIWSANFKKMSLSLSVEELSKAAMFESSVFDFGSA